MNNNQILEKAIKKAVDNGWEGKFPPIDDVELLLQATESIIFSHSFAKAFWGGDEEKDYRFLQATCPECGNPQLIDGMYVWQRRLQEMVLLENPLQYLEKFLQ